MVAVPIVSPLVEDAGSPGVEPTRSRCCTSDTKVTPPSNSRRLVVGEFQVSWPLRFGQYLALPDAAASRMPVLTLLRQLQLRSTP